MKTALVCGPCPQGACGVGDYTLGLARALNQRGIEAHIISSGNLSLLGAIRRHERSLGAKFDFVHIQYPTVGFGWAFTPQALSLLRRCVITIHEASGAHILRKLGLLPFSIRPKRVVFTSERERQFAVKWVPWISQVSCVIPIPSNICAFEGQNKRSLDEISYFGLIMPRKGLDSVITLAQLIKVSGPSFRIRIIGSCPPKHAGYLQELKSKTSALPIIWDCGLTEEQVAKRLASSSIAYLPYPDGVSERRASFKAALLNGMTVITTRGPHTPSSFESFAIFCANPKEALVAARSLAENGEHRTVLADKARHYARQFTWEGTAEAHVALYQNLMSESRSQDLVPLESSELENHFDSKSIS